MRLRVHCAIALVGLVLALVACATTASVSKPGFYTEVREGRVWVDEYLAAK